MATRGLYSVEGASELIQSGRVLVVGGDESLLERLPAGRWIGGTSANFMTAQGGVTDRDHIFVADISEIAESVELRAYSESEIADIGSHYPDNGFTALLVPGLSRLHESFARGVQSYAGVFNGPLYGWISGVHVSEIGTRAPKVFVGNGKGYSDRAAALHVTLPADKRARLDIVNLFSQGEGEDIEFLHEGFETTGECLIDGKPGNLAALIGAKAIDTKLPLVADYQGAQINVSLRELDAASGRVSFYAPVFKGTKYRFAKPIGDYTQEFARHLDSDAINSIALSCNCILNYLYADLEGRKTGALQGPITFGEIAYILLNQTLVYLTIEPA